MRGCGAAPVHVAFASENRSAVDAFHHAALAAGAEDYGAPRLCPEYHPNYYGAFVLDLDAVTISRPSATRQSEELEARLNGIVEAVALSPALTFSKVRQSQNRLVAGVGVDGDAHAPLDVI